MKLKLEKALLKDLEEILNLQKLAYKKEALIYNDFSIPPLTQRLEELKKDFKDHELYKVVLDQQIIGSIKVKVNDGTCYVYRVIVHPEYQRRGIGRFLMESVEKEIPLNRYELFTGSKSTDNIAFYQKLGYVIFKKLPLKKNIEIVYLEKMV